jgi:hypothetical protein
MPSRFPLWLIVILAVQFLMCASLPVLLYLLAWGNMPNGNPPAQFLVLDSEDRFFLIPLVLWAPLTAASILFWRWEGKTQAILCALAPFPLGLALIVYLLGT